MNHRTAPQTGRALNMQEKRKLEKLLLADIDTALSAYTSKRNTEQSRLLERVLANPSKKVRSLLSQIAGANDLRKRLEKQLNAEGYTVSFYDEKPKLSTYYYRQPEPVRAFAEATEKAKGALNELKRTYTLKLFAGDAQAQELFAALSKELEAIIV